MNRRILLTTTVALLVMPAVTHAALRSGAFALKSPPVTVRVEGLTANLLVPTVVRVPAGWITRDGAPKGECPARSVQGALNVATRRRWHGIWTTQFGPEYEINSILGEKHDFTSPYFWEIFLNAAPASQGACELRLHRGEHLLFAAVPQAGTAYPIAIRGVPRNATPGETFTVEVVWFDAQRQAHPLSGATVSGGGIKATTDTNGDATLVAPPIGPLILHARHEWSASTVYIRAAPVSVHIT